VISYSYCSKAYLKLLKKQPNLVKRLKSC